MTRKLAGTVFALVVFVGGVLYAVVGESAHGSIMVVLAAIIGDRVRDL